MTRNRMGVMIALSTVLVVGGLSALPIVLRAQQAGPRRHLLPQPKNAGVVVMLCDGKTSTEIKGVKPGEQIPHAQALAVAQRLMSDWQRQHPSQHWEMAQAETPAGGAPASAAGPGAPAASMSSSQPQTAAQPGGQPPALQQGDTYASFHERDYMIWQTETQKFVDKGNRIFHSAQELGSTIGMSCDMCHPNAANTHPETYPKYQVQLQRVALLRDMIDWCIENPVKGKALDPNDERLRALEAYILAQRKEVPLVYGKH